MNGIEIFDLNEKRQYHTVVSRWIYDEFIVGQRKGVSFDDIMKLFFESLDTDFPKTYVALLNNECVGTVSLVREDEIINCPYTPWLASLYVREDMRGNGLAVMLIYAVIELAKKLGYSKLYLRTEHADDYYLKRGWKLCDTLVDQYGLDTRIYMTNLEEA